MSVTHPEIYWLWAGLTCYLVGTLVSWPNIVGWQRRESAVLGALLIGVSFLALAITARWLRLGHGPFFNMFEILTSNLFSLGFIYALIYWRVPRLRATATIVLPILMVMVLWLWSLAPVDSHFPATYATPVLWFHVFFGKIFMGTALVAVGIAGVVMLRRSERAARAFTRMPDNTALDRVAWRFMQAALIFESVMLIMGALWAQDAWGRYWAWDPLETWAFVTWLTLAGAIHLRRAYKVSPFLGALLIWLVFILAFLTFFGVPFITVAPHKGAV